MTRTETAAINAQLTITKINGLRFAFPGGYVMESGYSLQHPKLGFLKFTADQSFVPYCPKGGRKALQSILDAGGLLDFECIEWVKPIK
jgi:hypothetical protein